MVSSAIVVQQTRHEFTTYPIYMVLIPNIYTEPKKKLPLCLSAVAPKISNDLHIFERTIMFPIKQILTRMKVFCGRNPLKAISTCMHGPVEFAYIF